MTGRRRRPGEMPRFGSVWSWGREDEDHFLDARIVLTVTPTGIVRHIPIGPAIHGPHQELRVQGYMAWGSDALDIGDWFCIDEGPDL